MIRIGSDFTMIKNILSFSSLMHVKRRVPLDSLFTFFWLLSVQFQLFCIFWVAITLLCKIILSVSPFNFFSFLTSFRWKVLVWSRLAVFSRDNFRQLVVLSAFSFLFVHFCKILRKVHLFHIYCNLRAWQRHFCMVDFPSVLPKPHSQLFSFSFCLCLATVLWNRRTLWFGSLACTAFSAKLPGVLNFALYWSHVSCPLMSVGILLTNFFNLISFSPKSLSLVDVTSFAIKIISVFFLSFSHILAFLNWSQVVSFSSYFAIRCLLWFCSPYSSF